MFYDNKEDTIRDNELQVKKIGKIKIRVVTNEKLTFSRYWIYKVKKSKGMVCLFLKENKQEMLTRYK